MEHPRREQGAQYGRSRFAAMGVVVLALVGLPSVARAQCAKDTDCKGDRICSAGSCVDGTSRKPKKVWALSAGASGVVSGGLTLGMAITADVLFDPERLYSTTSLIGAYLLTTIIQSPIIAVGGRSARVATGVEGERGARVGGWIFYGVGIASFPVIAAYGFATEGPPPHGWILGSGIACALSQALLAVDAFVSHYQAAALAPEAANLGQRAGPALRPFVAPRTGPDSVTGAVLGLGGSF